MYFYPRPLRGGRPELKPAIELAVNQISIHALCEEGDKTSLADTLIRKVFLSTPSARRATSRRGKTRSERGYFYPRPLRGGRLRYTGLTEEQKQFLSTPSARRATPAFLPLFRPLGISIHALCEEGDPPVSDWSLD